MNLREVAIIMKPLNLADREKLILARCRAEIRGVMRTLFLRAPVMPEVPQ